MSTRRIVIRGDSYIALETVAECYCFERAWIEAVYEAGLLGRGEIFESRTVIRTSLLDRVATIRRMQHYQGLALETVAILLSLDDD